MLRAGEEYATIRSNAPFALGPSNNDPTDDDARALR